MHQSSCQLAEQCQSHACESEFRTARVTSYQYADSAIQCIAQSELAKGSAHGQRRPSALRCRQYQLPTDLGWYGQKPPSGSGYVRLQPRANFLRLNNLHPKFAGTTSIARCGKRRMVIAVTLFVKRSVIPLSAGFQEVVHFFCRKFIIPP